MSDKKDKKEDISKEKKNKIKKVLDKESKKIEKHKLDMKPFFKSMFTTFGITLLVFFGLLFLLFLIKWVTSS